MESFFGTETSPSSGASSPTIIRNRVVLPDPLGPTRPTFSPGLSWNDASTNRICRPYCLMIRVKDTIGDCRLQTEDYRNDDWRFTIGDWRLGNLQSAIAK